MARESRIIAKTYPHHVTQRGNYKQLIFEGASDYSFYLVWLKDYSLKYHLDIVSYCLMPNHVHFIVIPQEYDSLAKTFHILHTKYSQYINKRKNQKGHLWQGRFYSTILSKDHLKEAIRYVENNPVKAKMVKSAEDWDWSSSRYYIKGESKNEIPLYSFKKYLGINDWKDYLSGKLDNVILEEVKLKTYSGFPTGKIEFVHRLEKELGRKIIPNKPGRPKKKKN